MQVEDTDSTRWRFPHPVVELSDSGVGEHVPHPFFARGVGKQQLPDERVRDTGLLGHHPKREDSAGGCSPEVLLAIQRLVPGGIAFDCNRPRHAAIGVVADEVVTCIEVKVIVLQRVNEFVSKRALFRS